MDIRTTTALLYLDDVSVSFDGFRALNGLSLAVEPGEMRAIIGPNGAGKTTMMDVITGKTQPDDGDVVFEGSIDLTRLDEAEHRQSRHRPEIPEADRVRHAHRRGQSVSRLPRDRRARANIKWTRDAGRDAPHRPHSRHHPPDARARPSRRQPVARAEAMARNRHAAGAGAEIAAGRRAGRRHDRRRNASDRRAAARRSIARRPWSWSSTT